MADGDLVTVVVRLPVLGLAVGQRAELVEDPPLRQMLFNGYLDRVEETESESDEGTNVSDEEPAESVPAAEESFLMAFPVAITTVTVSASFYTPSGVLTDVTGSVEFTPTGYRQSAAQDVMSPPIKLTCAVTDGVMVAAVLAATDDTDLPPVGLFYTVRELINGAPEKTYRIQLPLASPTVNLADITQL